MGAPPASLAGTQGFSSAALASSASRCRRRRLAGSFSSPGAVPAAAAAACELSQGQLSGDNGGDLALVLCCAVRHRKSTTCSYKPATGSTWLPEMRSSPILLHDLQEDCLHASSILATTKRLQ